jgi:Spy/CpxP family protein refolding chaperone
LPAVALAATLGTATAKPKAKASPSPSPATETQDATAASSPADTNTPAGGQKRTVSPDSLKKRYLTELQHQAGLTAAQEPKVKPIISTYVDNRIAVRNDASLTAAAKADKLKQLRAQYVSDINGVLTPDQQKKWASFMEARRQKLRAAREKAAANRKVSTGATTTQPTPAAKTSQ